MVQGHEQGWCLGVWELRRQEEKGQVEMRDRG
jgi:hypothetical protein